MMFIEFQNRLINVFHIKEAVRDDKAIKLVMTENAVIQLHFDTTEEAESFRRKLKSIQIAYNPIDVMKKAGGKHAG